MRARSILPILGLLSLVASTLGAANASRIASIDVILEGHAEPDGRKPVRSRRVHHTTITEEQVLNVLPLHVGDKESPEKVEQAVSYLKKWGRFAEINVDRRMDRDGVHLTFRLQDGDIVSGIDLYGTYPYLSARIRRSVTVHSGDLYDQKQSQEQGQKIASFYARQGYEGTHVDFEAKFNEGKHTVDLKYDVDKGKRYRIGRITVVGNTVFPRGYFISKVNPLLHYTPSRLRKSLDKIRHDYQDKGYIGARVRLGNLGKDDSVRTVNPTIEIKEGKRVTVLFTGNSRISRRTFKKILPMFTDGGYGTYEIESSEKAITDAYRKLGYQEVVVRTTRDETSENALLIRFAIHEGPQTRVKSIAIEGNREISDRKIKKRLLTRENTIVERGYYQPRTVLQDFERLPGLLHDRGALEARAVDHKTALNAFRDKAHVSFEVEEGAISRLAGIRFEGNRQFTDNKLKRRLEISEGDPVSASGIEKDREVLALFYANHGFPYATVQPEVSREGTQTVLRYKIDEGLKTEVGQVLVVGNERTEPRAIYRAMSIRSGQPFSYKKILDSEANLRRAGAFRSANIQTIGLTEKEPVVHLVVKVEEYRKIVLDVGATYDTDDFFTGDLSLTHLNLFGSIRRANVKLTGGRDIQKGELIFKDPYFLGYPFEASLSVALERDLEPGFKTVEGGGSLSFLREFTPRMSVLGRYSLIRTFFTDVVDAAGIPEADHTTSKFSFSFSYDKRDTYADPQRGYVGFAGVDISNKLIASTFNFIQPKGYFAHYLPLGSRSTLITFARMEGIKVFGGDALARDEKLFLGGDYSLRGFDEDAVGPIGADGRPGGGQLLLMASTELQTRLFNNFKLAFFMDMGSLTDNFSEVSLASFRNSAGAGFRYVTPVGQIRFDYAAKLDKRAGESVGRFHIAFGYAF